MDKRSALAMGLIFLLWLLYLMFMTPKPKPVQTAQTGKPAAEAAQTAQAPREEKKPEEAAPGTAQPGFVEPDTSQAPVDTIVVSSGIYEYQFITRGGVLTRARLKDYPAFLPGKKQLAEGQEPPVQLIPTTESFFLYTRLFLQNSNQPVELGARHFTADRLRLDLSKNNPEGTVTLSNRLAGGEELRLVYTFHYDSYLIESDLYLPAQLHASARNFVEVELGPGLVSNEKNPKNDLASYEAIYYDNGEIVQKTLKDLSKSDWTPSGEHSILWGGIRSQYFLAALYVPKDPMNAMSASGSPVENRVNFRGMFPIPQGDSPVHYALYVGPQAYSQITQLDYGLPKILEYGWSIIQPFTKMLLAILLWMHTWIPNYALIIVVFALLIKVVFYPLTIKSTKSQIKMQQIQPLVTEMREKFKDDPRKQQEEMLKLYREHKVNPLGGCLPLLIQMPVLFALFYVFQRTIEFRGAEGFFWIHDLSQPDPFYVLPVAMGITTFLQQKLTPTPTDPKMAPMLYIMPIMMTFIFLNFSSGLVFYYTVFNVIQIFQQMYITKRYHAPARAAAAVAGGGTVQATPAQRGGGGDGSKRRKK
jgi:YidC/Oxa1 family membrane protein insertase